MKLSALSFLLFSIGTIAGPSLLSRQTSAGGACAGLAGGTPTMPNFTFAAYNLSQPNANSTGAPLVLGNLTGPGGPYDVMGLTTYHSWPHDDYPVWTLDSGFLNPHYYIPDTMNTSAGPVTAGGALNWYVSTGPLSEQPQAIYCAVNTTYSPYPILAVNEEPFGFSLCLVVTGTLSQYHVIWKEDPAIQSYSDCYPVSLHMVSLS